MAWKSIEEKRLYQNAWYQKNKEKRREQIRLNISKRRGKLQQLILAYLQRHPCTDCGETDVMVLEFDHLRNKKANIAQLLSNIVSWGMIEKEIEKCEVVCANCHRRRTYRRSGSYRNASIAHLAEQGTCNAQSGVRITMEAH